RGATPSDARLRCFRLSAARCAPAACAQGKALSTRRLAAKKGGLPSCRHECQRPTIVLRRLGGPWCPPPCEGVSALALAEAGASRTGAALRGNGAPLRSRRVERRGGTRTRSLAPPSSRHGGARATRGRGQTACQRGGGAFGEAAGPAASHSTPRSASC